MVDDNSERSRRELSEAEGAAQRRTVRKRVLWAARLKAGARQFDCIVVDLSLGGARLHFCEPLPKGQMVSLILERIGTIGAEVVRQEERSVGLRFTDDPQHIAKLIGHRLPLVGIPTAAAG